MPHQTVTLLRELGKRLKPGTQTPQKYSLQLWIIFKRHLYIQK